MKTIRPCVKCGIQTKEYKTNRCKYCEPCRQKQILEYQKKYYKEWREKNKEKCQQKSKKYYIENIGKMTKYNKEYYKKNGREKAKEYYQENKERLDKKTKELSRKLSREVIKQYGGKCTCCGENTFEFLSIDHINNDGKEDRKKIGSGYSFYRLLRKLNYPKNNYQVLCYNCNLAKGFYGICPHQKK